MLNTSRRSLLTGLVSFAVCAPAVVRAASIMPVKAFRPLDYLDCDEVVNLYKYTIEETWSVKKLKGWDGGLQLANGNSLHIAQGSMPNVEELNLIYESDHLPQYVVCPSIYPMKPGENFEVVNGGPVWRDPVPRRYKITRNDDTVVAWRAEL